MEVASTTLRRPGAAGSMARSCSARSRAPNSGTISTAGSLTVAASSSAVRRISAAPGRKTSAEPLSSASARRTVRATSSSSRAAGSRPTWRVTTGKARPALSTTGAPPSRAATRAPSRVADMTRMRRSSRKAPWVSSASARPRSASRLRSWNSSKRTAATPSSVGSSRIMRVKMPSVTTSTRVRADTFEPKRTLRPTRPPTSSPSVLAIRSATARAAMRRGSSTRILPVPDQDSSISTSGTRVDLPAPGGATRTARVAPARASRRAGNAASMGRSDRDTPGVYGSFTASASAGAAVGPKWAERASGLRRVRQGHRLFHRGTHDVHRRDVDASRHDTPGTAAAIRAAPPGGGAAGPQCSSGRQGAAVRIMRAAASRPGTAPERHPTEPLANRPPPWLWSASRCGRSSMVERQLPKLHTRVRFPSPAPAPP